MSTLVHFLENSETIIDNLIPANFSEEVLANALVAFQKLEKTIGTIRDKLKNELFRRTNNLPTEINLANIKFTTFQKTKVAYLTEEIKALANLLNLPLETFGKIDLIPDSKKIEALLKDNTINLQHYKAITKIQAWMEYRTQKNPKLIPTILSNLLK